MYFEYTLDAGSLFSFKLALTRLDIITLLYKFLTFARVNILFLF